MAGFIGLNVFKDFDEAKENMVRQTKTFSPNEENAKKYNDIYNNVYLKIYKNVKKIYTKMNNINL